MKKPIPKFASENAEREFWATHDSADYVDWRKARRVTLASLSASNGLAFRLLFFLSIVLAASNLVLPLGFPLILVYPIGAIWACVVLITTLVHGKRGLWLLIGAPLALFWPLVLVTVMLGYADLP